MMNWGHVLVASLILSMTALTTAQTNSLVSDAQGLHQSHEAQQANRLNIAISPVAQRLFDYELRNGSAHRAQQRRSASSALFIHRQLARELGEQPFVQARTADGAWLTSYVLDRQLHVVQVRPASGGSRVIESQFTPPRNAVASGRWPFWWPRLLRPWMRRSTDAGVQTTSMMGWYPGHLAQAQRVVTGAAARAGIHMTTRVPVATSAPGHRAGVMLVLNSANAELMVTLSAGHQRTGIVAHLREHVR